MTQLEYAVPGLNKTRRKIIRLIARDGALCVWCGANLAGAEGGGTLDHLRPQARGGAANIDNLALSCEPCNTLRGNVPAWLWGELCLALGLDLQLAQLQAALERLRERADTPLVDIGWITSWQAGEVFHA